MQFISAEQRQSKSLELTKEGQEIAEKGSYEALIFNAIPAGGVFQAELMVNSHLFLLVVL